MTLIPQDDGELIELVVPEDSAPSRLDRALVRAAAACGLSLSRSRIAQLIHEGFVTDHDGKTVSEPARRVKAGQRLLLVLPPAVETELHPEDIPLAILFEDEHLIVVDKPSGMVVHPAPGATSGTLVNALLAHCGTSLSGIGGALRPGIVHRIDKDTSGLLVVAKTKAAYTGLAAQFALHTVKRSYLAVLWGAPSNGDRRLAGLRGVSHEANGWIRIETAIARHRTDRKRMAVAAAGRRSVTRLRVIERFGREPEPLASLTECRLETGRTHQIRVHARYLGHSLVGDPVYGRPHSPARQGETSAARAAALAFPRQALHARTLGFVHPITQTRFNFCATIPTDLQDLLLALRRNL